MDIKVLLDSIEIKNIPRGIDKIALSLIREDGYGNSEQIFRESNDISLDFWGDGFKYICNMRKKGLCTDINIKVYVECKNEYVLIFDGTIKQNKVKIELNKCIAEISNIKDNGFSAYIRDYIDVDVSTYNVKTKNCYDLSLVEILINTPTIPNNYTITNIKAFDVLDMLNYLVRYFTDNKISVVSDYYTTYKYAITTGYNLHNSNGLLSKQYPKLSISKLFNELRKKHAVYMSVEYNNSGNPFLRVEPETYFYKDIKIMDIDELPKGTTESIDANRLFNVVNVGSNNTTLVDKLNSVKTEDELNGWIKNSFIGCGGCSAEKENSKLDLVSDFIIDTNLIHEAMLQPLGNDYENDDAIFLLNYYNSSIGGVLYKLVGNNTTFYNDNINNENVLNNWVGISNSCIAISRFSKNGFRAYNGNYDPNSQYIDGFSIKDVGSCQLINLIPATHWLGCNIESYDLNNSHSLHNDHNNGNGCTTGGKESRYECMQGGIYDFHAYSDIKCYVVAPTNTDDLEYAKFNVRFVVFQDNTLTTTIQTTPYTEVLVSNNTDVFNFDINSGDLSLDVGNVVMVEVTLFEIGVDFGGREYDFVFFNSIYEMTKDSNSCADISDELGLFKPYLTTIEYPLCLDEFNAIKSNKYGYFNVRGQKMWIKKVEFSITSLSQLQLVHNDSICGCIA